MTEGGAAMEELWTHRIASSPFPSSPKLASMTLTKYFSLKDRKAQRFAFPKVNKLIFIDRKLN